MSPFSNLLLYRLKSYWLYVLMQKLEAISFLLLSFYPHFLLHTPKRVESVASAADRRPWFSFSQRWLENKIPKGDSNSESFTKLKDSKTCPINPYFDSL
jgi:hypothetical protein